MPNAAKKYDLGKVILFFPIMYNTITLLYCLLTGTYNGDYLGYKYRSSIFIIIAYLLSFIPLIIYGNFINILNRRRKPNKYI